jgi:hydrogenase-4 component F
VILWFVLAVPLAAALLCGLPGGQRVAAPVTIAGVLTVLVLALRIAALTSDGMVVAWPDVVAVDGLSALIVLLVALVGSTAAIYSWGYMARASGHEPARLRVYYANFNLFVFSMLAIPLVVEPTLVWIFVELTTLSSALLVSFERTHAALEAAWKYVALSLMGAAIALLGFLLLFAAMQASGDGAYTWTGLLAAAPRMPPTLLQTAFLLILVGFGTKVGLVPLHTWLPDAHSQAPSPVCALLSGIETTSVLYVILRLLPVLGAAAVPNIEAWAIAFGLVSAGTAAGLLLQVRDYKRLFAYSTIEHMGIILVAAGMASPAAHYAAMAQVVNHTVTKSFCFFAAGAALLALGTRDIAAVRGLIRSSPAAGASLLLGGLGVAGAPPLAIFLSEFAIVRAGVAEGRTGVVALLLLFIAVGFIGVMLHINRMVFGRPAASMRVAGLPKTCIAILVAAGTLVIVLGLFVPAPLHELLQRAATAVQR